MNRIYLRGESARNSEGLPFFFNVFYSFGSREQLNFENRSSEKCISSYDFEDTA
jgi:hypothetical protein